MLQDLFKSGAVKSATDFQVYQELAGLSGLDFAYADNTAVYHTKVLNMPPNELLYYLFGNMLFSTYKGNSATLIIQAC